MGFKKFVEMFQFKEDYEDYDDEEYEEEDVRLGRNSNLLEDDMEDEEEYIMQDELLSTPSPKTAVVKKQENEQRKVRPVKMDRTVSSNKVVPIKSTSKNLEVCILKPTSLMLASTARQIQPSTMPKTSLNWPPSSMPSHPRYCLTLA